MGIKDIFKPRSKRANTDMEERVRKRQTERRERTELASRTAAMDQQVDSLNAELKELKTGRDEAWKEAEDYLRGGNEPAATASLKAMHETLKLTTWVESQLTFAKRLRVRIKVARTEQQMRVAAAQLINTLAPTKPESVAVFLDRLLVAFDDQDDIIEEYKEIFDDQKAHDAAEVTAAINKSMADLKSVVASGVQREELEAGSEIKAGRDRIEKFLKE